MWVWLLLVVVHTVLGEVRCMQGLSLCDGGWVLWYLWVLLLLAPPKLTTDVSHICSRQGSAWEE